MASSLNDYLTRYPGARFTWTSEFDSLLGTMPDCDLAKQLGISRGTVIARRKKLHVAAWGLTHEWRRYTGPTDWSSIDPLIGKLTDEKLARICNASLDSITRRRHKLGIAPYRHLLGIDWDRVPLGEHPDYEIAETLGTTKTTVWFERNRRDIPPYKTVYGMQPCADHDWIERYRDGYL